jgi:hypothetical protein
MQRQIGTFRIAGLVVALGGCVASGGDGSILVVKAVAPPTTATGGVCTFTSSDAEAGLVHGALDVASGFGYQIVAQLRSRITADATQAGQADARTISLRGANVDLTFPDAGMLSAQITDLKSKGLLHFMAPISGSLSPNDGLADAPFELIPAGVAAELRATAAFTSTVVQATFTVVGDLAGGNVSSQAFHYSVTLGKQNLIMDKGLCSTVSKTFVPQHPGNLCYPGQDFAIDCCEGPPNKDGSTNFVCPAVGTAM